MILHEKGIEFENSGNKVFNAACSLLVMLKNSWSKLYCQKGFDLIIFSYHIPSSPTAVLPQVRSTN